MSTVIPTRSRMRKTQLQPIPHQPMWSQFGPITLTSEVLTPQTPAGNCWGGIGNSAAVPAIVEWSLCLDFT